MMTFSVNLYAKDTMTELVDDYVENPDGKSKSIRMNRLVNRSIDRGLMGINQKGERSVMKIFRGQMVDDPNQEAPVPLEQVATLPQTEDQYEAFIDRTHNTLLQTKLFSDESMSDFSVTTGYNLEKLISNVEMIFRNPEDAPDKVKLIQDHVRTLGFEFEDINQDLFVSTFKEYLTNLNKGVVEYAR